MSTTKNNSAVAINTNPVAVLNWTEWFRAEKPKNAGKIRCEKGKHIPVSTLKILEDSEGNMIPYLRESIKFLGRDLFNKKARTKFTAQEFKTILHQVLHSKSNYTRFEEGFNKVKDQFKKEAEITSTWIALVDYANLYQETFVRSQIKDYMIDFNKRALAKSLDYTIDWDKFKAAEEAEKAAKNKAKEEARKLKASQKATTPKPNKVKATKKEATVEPVKLNWFLPDVETLSVWKVEENTSDSFKSFTAAKTALVSRLQLASREAMKAHKACPPSEEKEGLLVKANNYNNLARRIKTIKKTDCRDITEKRPVNKNKVKYTAKKQSNGKVVAFSKASQIAK